MGGAALRDFYGVLLRVGSKKIQAPALLLAAVLACAGLTASADLISSEVREAHERLRANPDTYDRVDNFCAGKKPGAACSIPGNTFSGGGAGLCSNSINRETSTIDLSCVRNGEVWIDRKLPDGGFVNDPALCQREEGKESDHRWNCQPVSPPPSDQFCTGKKLGSRCIVELVYQNKKEKHEGLCEEITETESFYFEGHRTATRQVIRCEPPLAASRTYTPVNWREKLFK